MRGNGRTGRNQNEKHLPAKDTAQDRSQATDGEAWARHRPAKDLSRDERSGRSLPASSRQPRERMGCQSADSGCLAPPASAVMREKPIKPAVSPPRR